jgi:zinc transporter ZupT
MVIAVFAFSFACSLFAAAVGKRSDVEGAYEYFGGGHEQCYDEDAYDSSTLLLQVSLEVAPPVVMMPEPNVTHKAKAAPVQPVHSTGIPLHLEALMFGLFSALSMPIGAVLGVMFAPMRKAVIAKWLAFGAGALVFAVATQIYGDSLFALVALSRRYGPFDQGCAMVQGRNICTEKFWGMIQQILAGIGGAFLYVVLERWIRKWFSEERGFKDGRWDYDFGTTRHPSFDYDDDDVRASTGRNQRSIALAMWAAMLLDSIPESLMLGFMTNHHQLRFGFLFAIFLSNFPEAFSSAGILHTERMSICLTCSLWSSVFIITGIVAMLGSLMASEVSDANMFPMNFQLLEGFAQGVSGGMMLAMMSVVMLPEAYKGAGSIAGVYFVCGFGFSVFVQTLDSYLAGPQSLLHHHFHRAS